MKKTAYWFTLTTLLAAMAAACSSGGDFDEAQWRAGLQQWRDGRVPKLVGDRGWATVSGLDWLKEGENTLGSATGSTVQFESGSAAPKVGVIWLRDDLIQFEADPAAEVYQGADRVSAVEILPDDTGAPTILRTGSVQFSVIRRGTQLAVRTWDSNAESAANLSSIPNFEANPNWVKKGEFIRYKPIRSIELVTAINVPETNPLDGYLQFEHEGETYTLDVIAVPSDTTVFVIFGDLTNRGETYGAGRYLYVARPDTSADRSTVYIDFNKAYNPPCAFTAYATCAYPHEANKLPFRVEAGEKRVVGH